MNRPLAIEVCELTKHFGDTLAVNQISFEVPAGTITALLGGATARGKQPRSQSSWG